MTELSFDGLLATNTTDLSSKIVVTTFMSILKSLKIDSSTGTCQLKLKKWHSLKEDGNLYSNGMDMMSFSFMAEASSTLMSV